VTARAKTVTVRAATAHVAKRVSAIAPPGGKDPLVTVRSATDPVTTVIAPAASGQRVTSPAAASRAANPALASRPSENRASVANGRGFPEKALAARAPAVISRAARARVANLLEAGE
jgi:hypothetical protein